jgi:CheY-like chemotaxis protein
MKTWQVLMLLRRDRAIGVPPLEHASHARLEDLERLALDKITPADRLKLETHLRQCSGCRQMLEEAQGFAEQLAQLAASPNPFGERRRAVRYKVNEGVIVTLCNPPDFVPVRGEIVNASTLGLLVRIPRNMHRGGQVYIQVENAAVFGTIRYSREGAGQTYDIGVAIDQVVMRPGLAPAIDSPADVPVSEAPVRPTPTARELENKNGGTAAHLFEILCIEDNPGDIRIVEMILDEIRIPHHLSIARDGAQALQRLRDSAAPRPDLVLLDLNLPRVNGFEFLEKVRRDQNLYVLPIVILSSSTARADLERAAELGVRAYFQKPDDLERQSELRCSMEILLSQLTGISS